MTPQEKIQFQLTNMKREIQQLEMAEPYLSRLMEEENINGYVGIIDGIPRIKVFESCYDKVIKWTDLNGYAHHLYESGLCVFGSDFEFYVIEVQNDA